MNWLSITDPKEKAIILISGGGATSLVDLQFAAGIAADEDFSPSAQVCLNKDRQIEAGLEVGTSMPMWAINGAQDYDANQYRTGLMKGETTSDQGAANCLVATGGYELAVTEYNIIDYTAANYVPGQTLLTNDVSAPGDIEPCSAVIATRNKSTVLGCVSYGIEIARVGLNRARLRLSQKALLRFWTMYIPPISV